MRPVAVSIVCSALIAIYLANEVLPSAAPPPCPRCSNISITVENSDKIEMQRNDRELTRAIWAHPAFQSVSPLVAELRDVLAEMGASESFYFSRVAFGHATLMAGYLAVNRYYSLCSYAQVLNDTVKYAHTQDAELQFDMLRRVSKNVFGLCKASVYASGKYIGCKNVSEPEIPAKECYENGLVFCAEEFWKLYGGLLPCPLANIFHRLYNSSNYAERAHAVLLAYAANPIAKLLFNTHPQAPVFETMAHFVESKNVSRCCCRHKLAKMNSLCVLHNVTAQADAEKIIKNLVDEDCHD